MHINEVSKVYIIGSVASGKTTMARPMSKKLSVLPLKSKLADGSPVRAIAIESIEY